MEKRPWLTPSELAKREGVTSRCVWKWVEKGAVEIRRLPRTDGGRRGVGVRMRLREDDDEDDA